MIFVSTGSEGFTELVKEIDALAPKLNERVIVNIGYSNYKPKNCEWVGYTGEFESYVKRASLVITHGGAGSIFTCLKLGARLIAIPNPKHIDNQDELVDQLNKDGYLINCKNIKHLKDCINLARKHNFKKYASPKCEIGGYILQFLEGA